MELAGFITNINPNGGRVILENLFLNCDNAPLTL
jgi:hypothetical protein